MRNHVNFFTLMNFGLRGTRRASIGRSKNVRHVFVRHFLGSTGDGPPNKVTRLDGAYPA